MKGKSLFVIAILAIFILSGISLIVNAQSINYTTVNNTSSSSATWWSDIKGASMKSMYLGETGPFIIADNMIIIWNTTSTSASTLYYYNATSGVAINAVSLSIGSGFDLINLAYSGGYTYIVGTILPSIPLGPDPITEITVNPNFVVSEKTYPDAYASVGPYIVIPSYVPAHVYYNTSAYSKYWVKNITDTVKLTDYLNGFDFFNYETGTWANYSVANMPFFTFYSNVSAPGQSFPWQGAGIDIQKAPGGFYFAYVDNEIYAIVPYYTLQVSSTTNVGSSEYLPLYQNISYFMVYSFGPGSSPNQAYVNSSFNYLLMATEAPSSNVLDGSQATISDVTTFYNVPNHYERSTSAYVYVGNFLDNNTPYILDASIPFVSGGSVPYKPFAIKLGNLMSEVQNTTLNYNLKDEYPVVSLIENGQYANPGALIAYGPGTTSSTSTIYILDPSFFNVEYSFQVQAVSNTEIMPNPLSSDPYPGGFSWAYISTSGVFYGITLPHSISLNVNIFGLPSNIRPQINVFNSTFNSSFSISVMPGQIQFNTTIPNGYTIQNISITGPGLSGLNSLLKSYEFRNKFANFTLNISNDPTMNITFAPLSYNISFISNLNLGTTWLVDHGLQKNVTWTAEIFHGSDPSQHVFNSNYLPSNDSNDTNYTLIYSVNTQNMTFHLANGTYSYKIISGSTEFIAPNGGNMIVSGSSQSINVDFTVNYPHAVISFVPQKIPVDTAWVLSAQNSSGGQNLSVSSYLWTITGPLYYQFSGETNVVYFNVTGNYTISLTVSNQYGLKNTTSVTTEVIKFTKTPEIYLSISLKGTLTNTSAEYQVEVRIPSNMSIASVEGLIDNSSAMNIKFVNSSISGNYTYYFYLASFDPSNYQLGTHFLNFSAYTTNGYFDYKYLTLKFGSTKTAPFNLINFFGGPANFWAMVAALVGIIVTVAALKVQRTSDVIIEANGHESVLKAKPVKTRKLKNKNKGGKKL